MKNTAFILSDNYITNSTIPNLLQEYGVHEVVHIDNVSDAIAQAKRFQPEFVFLDYQFLENHIDTLCVDLLSVTDCNITVMAVEEKEEIVRKDLDFNWNSLGFLSTPFSSKEIEHIVVQRYTEHFYGSLA
jgi:AmiR/NasT family two-component response regulator